VTVNISPAPSQSFAVMIGVCAQTKPRPWKNSCTAYKSTLRTRKTAPKVLERGRRWAISRKNSSVWPFFCSGYASASAPPRTSIRSARISTDWPLPWEARSVPTTRTEAPVLQAASCSNGCVPASTITCRLSWEEPSFRTTNANAFDSRFERTQPQTVVLAPGAAASSPLARIWEMRVRCMAFLRGAGESGARAGPRARAGRARR
jgi:hypothetical protein